MGSNTKWTVDSVLVSLTLFGILTFLTLFRYITLAGHKLGHYINHKLCYLCNEPLPEKPFKENVR